MPCESLEWFHCGISKGMGDYDFTQDSYVRVGILNSFAETKASLEQTRTAL